MHNFLHSDLNTVLQLNMQRDMRAGDCRKLTTHTPLVAAALLPRLRLVSLYGCSAGSLAAENALSELSVVLRCGSYSPIVTCEA